jgi:hypothetical protein
MIRDWDTCALSRRERRVARALLESIYVAVGDPEAHEVLARVEAWFASPHAGLRLMLRALLVGLELGPFVYGFGLTRMSALSMAQRQPYLLHLERAGSPALDMWKSVLGIAYFGGPEGQPSMDLVRGSAVGFALLIPFPNRRPQPRKRATGAHS